MAAFEWVIFDLGGVLLEVNHRRIIERLHTMTSHSPVEVEARLRGAPFLHDRFMIEEVSPERITEVVNKTLERELSQSDVIEALNAELGPEISTTVELLPTLKRKTQVACLSNTNSIHWDKLLRDYRFMGAFDRRFASQILGCAKPGREIYERVVQHLGVHPHRILFFDDRDENVESALRAGWRARKYTNHAQLMEDLKVCGVFDGASGE